MSGVTTNRLDQPEPARVVPPGQVVYVVRRRRRWPWLFPAAGLLLLLAVLVGDRETGLRSGWVPLRESELYGEGADKVALIRLEGVLEDAPETLGRAGCNRVRYFVSALRLAEADDAVKALVLEVNSPGGGITASDVMWRALTEFKKSGKPVVALLGDVAASGGYYVAAAADRILAHPTTLTGSIGVIIFQFNLEDLLAKVGVKENSIKSGEHKDIFSPFREMTPGERADVQAIVDVMLGRFVEVIVSGRGLEEEAVRRLADGSVFDARRAVEIGLVDSIGYLDDAVTAALELAGVAEARVVEYGSPPSLLQHLGLGALASPGPAEALLGELRLFSGPRLMYLWSPGR